MKTDTFEPQEARRIAEKLEIHYTPKHASWLNMAEIEIGFLSRQCLVQRTSCIDDMRNQLNAWQTRRNANSHTVDWHFTTHDARVKLKSLYPKLLG